MQDDKIYIILADDDADDRMFFTEAFEELKMNTKVDTFNDGAYLMDYFKQDDCKIPSVLFLDLNMPRKNGMECLREIKANKRFSNMAVAIYSTSASEEDIENTFVEGANIYIKKPSDFKALKKILANVVTINWQYHSNGLNKENFLMRL